MEREIPKASKTPGFFAFSFKNKYWIYDSHTLSELDAGDEKEWILTSGNFQLVGSS